MLPLVIEQDSVEVVADTIMSDEQMTAEALTQVMVSMLATNTSIEECGVYARAQIMLLSEKPWTVIVGVKDCFVIEEKSEEDDPSSGQGEQIILST